MIPSNMLDEIFKNFERKISRMPESEQRIYLQRLGFAVVTGPTKAAKAGLAVYESHADAGKGPSQSRDVAYKDAFRDGNKIAVSAALGLITRDNCQRRFGHRHYLPEHRPV
ncbi:MAG: hypothetical protein FWF24_01915 [Alphaproteobacteria bacterium]|nr:hypothetical protein [Alphaproteobacteria bacterium]